MSITGCNIQSFYYTSSELFPTPSYMHTSLLYKSSSAGDNVKSIIMSALLYTSYKTKCQLTFICRLDLIQIVMSHYPQNKNLQIYVASFHYITFYLNWMTYFNQSIALVLKYFILLKLDMSNLVQVKLFPPTFQTFFSIQLA